MDLSRLWFTPRQRHQRCAKHIAGRDSRYLTICLSDEGNARRWSDSKTVDSMRKRSWGVNGFNRVSKGYDILPISPTAVAMKPKPTPLGVGCYHHEQHAYAYELFGFKRRDELEIGPLFKGKGREARELYIHDVSEVKKNCKRFLVEDYDVFIVANDKFNMYPTIAEMAGMHIITRYKRPVLNRTEKNRGKAYAETIFHLKEKGN